ncbi:hypothetical protein [Roseovarius sp. Pro17]|uniref:hypothetical protein n=1 Tax=Roseovarius sp. Pro17 TaxID=3108175 RepID=UPI002D7803E0|nr:hypothetical protein [Roseovarius sp. Pro17]
MFNVAMYPADYGFSIDDFDVRIHDRYGQRRGTADHSLATGAMADACQHRGVGDAEPHLLAATPAVHGDHNFCSLASAAAECKRVPENLAN